MFNNPFLKKDPLLEAVKTAQADGETRRAAIAMVNEEFGVYSRNAVIRENLAAYDARIEETYKALKEGKPLDPVGKEDDDVNNNGIKNDKSDKYLLNRRKTIGRAMGKRMEEGTITTDAGTKMSDEGHAGEYHEKNTPAERNTKATFDRMRQMKEGSMYAGKNPFDPKDSDATPASKTISKGPYEDPSTPKVPYSELPKPGNRAGEVIDSAKPRGGLKEAVKKEYDDKDQSEHGVYKGKKKLGYVVKDKKSGTHTAYHGPSDGDYENIDDFPSKRKAVKQIKQSANLYKNMEESAYSAKSARAGKDIGKPGKNFAKIAKKAGEKYGSEEKGKKVAGAILAKIRAKHMKEDSSFNAAQETGKSVNEAVDAGPTPSWVNQPAPGVHRASAKAGVQRLQGGTFFRGTRASTSGPGSAKLVPQTTARASAPPAPGSRALVPSGSRAPVATGGGASGAKLPATTGSRGLTASAADAPKAKASSGFSWSRVGKDRPIFTATNADRANPVFTSGAAKATAKGIAMKALGKAAGVAGLAVPDDTKTEPGNPVFRKNDAGKTQVAGYRSATEPRKTDVNTTSRMVGDMSRRSGMAPSVKNQELPNKIAPVTTKAPGTLSAPVAKAAAAPKAETPKAAAPTVKQSFSQAYKAARSTSAGSKAQFDWGGKTFQAAAKKSEYVVPSKQIKVDVGSSASAAKPVPTPPSRPADLNVPAAPKPETATAAPKPETAKPASAPDTSTSMSISGKRTEFGNSEKYSMPNDMKGSYEGPSPSNKLRMPKELRGVNEEDKKELPDFKADIKAGGPMTSPLTSKDFAKRPPSTMKEEVQVGDNKYRIV